MTEKKINIQGIYSKGYGIVSKLVMQDTNISCVAKTIYSYFCSYTGGGNTCFPSRNKICYDLGISKDTLGKHLKQLIEAGYIKVEQAKENGRYSHNVYTIITTLSKCPNDSVSEKLAHEKLTPNNNSLNKNSILNKNSVNNNMSGAISPDNNVIGLPTNKFNTQGEEYHVSKEFYNTMAELYPNTNVLDELKRMRAWLLTNKQKRKTLSGMEKFINSWLSRQQNNTTYQHTNITKNKVQDKYSVDKDYSGGWD